MRVRRARLLAVVGALAVVAAACSGGSKTNSANTRKGPGNTVIITAPAKLSGAELRFGASASKSDSFTYQPDVVVLDGGARSIKSGSSNGLIWTIDGHASNADQIQPGKILLATSFAAGRVLAVSDVGVDKQVAIGPVSLTDVIQDGSFRTDTPLPLTGFQAYSTPDQPGLDSGTQQGADDGSGPDATATTVPSATSSALPVAPGASSGPLVLPTVHLAAQAGAQPLAMPAQVPSIPPVPGVPPIPSLPPLPSPASDVPASQIGAWHVESSCCTDAQIHIQYDKGGARVQGTALLGFTKPSLSFGITIGGGKLVTASAHLSGAAKLGFGISASVQSSAADFHGGRIQLPVDMDIPVPVAGLPVTIGVHQIFGVNLGLSGEALLGTSGEYALAGSLGFSVVNGTPTFDKPTLTTTKSALDNVQSLAVAPQGLTFSYAVKLSIGIGVPGASAGVWYQVAAALSMATSGARVDPLQGTSLVACKTISLSVTSRYGVGYRMPELVASAINLFLSTFFKKVKPIPAVGGPEWGPSTLFEKALPPCSK